MELALVVLTVTVIGLMWHSLRMEQAYRAERATLLDRLMARDLGEFKAFQPRPAAAPRQLTEAERIEQQEEARVAELANGLV